MSLWLFREGRGGWGGLVVWVLASSFGLASCFFVVDSALLCCSAGLGFFADLGPNHRLAYEFGESLDGCFFVSPLRSVLVGGDEYLAFIFHLQR